MNNLAFRGGHTPAERLRAAVALPTGMGRWLGSPEPGTQGEIRGHLRAVALTAAVLVLGVGGWAGFTSLDGAVVASGQLVVESEVKKVQHPTGGVVGELRVREGDHVKAGEVLVRLDETQTLANLDIVLHSLDELLARQARNEAERDGAESVTFPDELQRRAGEPAVARLMQGETRLFATRRAGREGQKGQLAQRISQVRQEVVGLGEQIEAKGREIELIEEELRGVRELRARNIVPLSRLNALERDAARLGGEKGQLEASRAQAEGKITETRMQIDQVDTDMRAEVGKDLADIRGRIAELREKKVSAEDQLKRTNLRAPQDGVVHQMTVHTVGGLVTASEPAMLIVPEADRLAVEVRIQPQDIDHVRLDQPAVLRFPAFNQRTTPDLRGEVSRVSADVSQDARSGQSYYTARITVPDGERGRLGGARLVPGMPVECFIQTGARTVMAYLTKPLADQVAKAWREP